MLSKFAINLWKVSLLTARNLFQKVFIGLGEYFS